jgi:hypothetical protein
MGYRDDTTALQGRLQVLQREAKTLEAELAQLQQERDDLRQRIRRKRFRVALVRAGRWMARHPKTSVFLALVLGVTVLITVKTYQERRERRLKMEATLGKGCSTHLKVDASYGGSRVLVNGTDVGHVPLDVPICRGYYRVQVIHRRALPWQRIVNIGVQPSVELQATLVPFYPRERPPGVLVFSDPPGAILFADGEEAGRTPVLLQLDKIHPSELHLALWSGSVTSPLQLWKGEYKPRALWFHMGGTPR